jgi:hypothetical protein
MSLKKQNRWSLLILVLAMIALMLLPGCGSDDSAAPSESGGDAPEPAADQPAISGDRHETDNVSMIIADGWEVMDIDGGIQAYKGMSRAVEVWVRGSGMGDDSARESIENFASNYDGTDVQEMNMHGLTFYYTTFDFSGMFQTKYSAIKDGQKVEITLAGEDHLNDGDTMGMFNSIVLK